METMNACLHLVKYIILGMLQGFTEPIPISSSGHLVIVREIFNVQIEGLSFEIMVNFGSLIAILIIYWKDIHRLTTNSIHYLAYSKHNGQRDFHFVICLLIATLPTGIIGLLLDDYIERKLSGMTVVGITLLLTGTALWIIRNLKGHKHDQDITLLDAFVVGLAQSVALIPGVSRSGATIVAAMLTGMTTTTALRFSFLLYIPVSLGISILSASDLINRVNLLNTENIPLWLAFASSIIVTYYALIWFMNVMEKGRLKYFALYCFVAGTLVLLYL